MRIHEDNLTGAQYSPDQLGMMNFDRSNEEPLIVHDQKAIMTIRLECDTLPLMNFMSLFIFLEGFYDMLYLFLFSQYESVKELKELLSGQIYHKLFGRPTALHLKRISMASPLELEVVGQFPVILFLFTLLGATQKDIFLDLYKRVADTLFKTNKTMLEEELLKAEIISKYADVYEKAKKINVHPAELAPSDISKDNLPPALLKDSPDTPREVIEKEEDSLADKVPHVEILQTFMLYEQEGLITNKLPLEQLAVLFKALVEQMMNNFVSVKGNFGDIKIEIRIVQDNDDDSGNDPSN